MSFLSSENPKHSCNSLNLSKDNDYVNEKIRSLKKIIPGYNSTKTRIINKVTKQINLNSDVKDMQRHELKLQNLIQNICDITSKLHEVVIGEKKLENILNFSNEKEFRVIQIYKSKNNYTHQFTNANIQKSKSGDRQRHRHTDHSVHTTRSIKHHLFSNPKPSYFGEKKFGDNSSVNVRPPNFSSYHGVNSS